MAIKFYDNPFTFQYPMNYEGVHTLKPFFISIKPFFKGACTCQNREVHPKVYYFSIENMRLYNMSLQFGARIHSLHWIQQRVHTGSK